MSEKIYVGLDLGGTAIKVGLCNEQGHLLQSYEGPTGTGSGTPAIIDNIVKYIRELVDQINPPTRGIKWKVSAPGWRALSISRTGSSCSRRT